MPWLLALPDHQQPWCWRRHSTSVISVWRNVTKCKYISVSLKNISLYKVYNPSPSTYSLALSDMEEKDSSEDEALRPLTGTPISSSSIWWSSSPSPGSLSSVIVSRGSHSVQPMKLVSPLVFWSSPLLVPLWATLAMAHSSSSEYPITLGSDFQMHFSCWALEISRWCPIRQPRQLPPNFHTGAHTHSCYRHWCC